MTDIFSEVKRLVSMTEAVIFYGYTPNRGGFICCPFHSEKTPSCKIYVDHFKCYGCGAGGSVIDLVVGLYNLSPLDAAKKLNDDFRLNLPFDKKDITVEEREAISRRKRINAVCIDFETWKSDTLRLLNAAYRKAHIASRQCRELTSCEALALKWREAVEHWSDCLDYGDIDTQMEIFRDREAITGLCNRILSDTQTKSKTA